MIGEPRRVIGPVGDRDSHSHRTHVEQNLSDTWTPRLIPETLKKCDHRTEHHGFRLGKLGHAEQHEQEREGESSRNARYTDPHSAGEDGNHQEAAELQQVGRLPVEHGQAENDESKNGGQTDVRSGSWGKRSGNGTHRETMRLQAGCQWIFGPSAPCFKRVTEFLRASKRTQWHLTWEGLATNCLRRRVGFETGARVFLGGCYSPKTGEIESTA